MQGGISGNAQGYAFTLRESGAPESSAMSLGLNRGNSLTGVNRERFFDTAMDLGQLPKNRQEQYGDQEQQKWDQHSCSPLLLN